MSKVLENTKPKALLFQTNYEQQAEALRDLLPPRQLYSIDKAAILSTSFDQFIDEDPSLLIDPQAGVDDGWLIIPTATVDGIPKGALLSQRNVMASAAVHLQHFGREAIKGHLVALPIFHVMGLTSAWATFISQMVVLVVFLYYFFIRGETYLSPTIRGFVFDRKIFKQILKIGFPASLSMLIMSMGNMFWNRLIANFGTEAVAAYGLGGRLDSVYFLPTFALASGMVTLTGMFYGAKRVDLIRETVCYVLIRGQILALSFGLIFYFFSPLIFMLFTSRLKYKWSAAFWANIRSRPSFTTTFIAYLFTSRH